MHRPDFNTIDPSQQLLRLADDVRVWPVRERGELVYRLEIPSLHRFFRVGYEEYVLISLLDGNTTLPQACGLAAAQLKQHAPTTQQATAIATWLLENQLAHPNDCPPPTRDRRGESKAASPPSASSLLSRLNPFWIKIPITKRHATESIGWVDSIAKPASIVFSPLAVLAGCLLIICGGASLIANWSSFSQAAVSIASPNNWLWLLTTWIGLKVIHELGHAAACHRQGGSISEAGIVLVLFAPLAYVDVSSCWRMNSRWRRIGVSAAGIYVEWLIAAIAILLLTQTQSLVVQHALHSLIITAGVSTLVFNANVLMRFDGYFVLADLIDMPNLGTESNFELRRLAKRFAFAHTVSPSQYFGWRLWFLRTYGLAALGWRFIICVTLGIAASTMFAGGGIVIAAMGVVLWLGLPLKQFARFVNEQWMRQSVACVRGCSLLAACVIAAVAFVACMPIPTSVRSPAMVRFVPESLVRSGSEGFLTAIHVRDGDVAAPGDLLVELDNPELRQRLAERRLELAKTKIQRRRANQRGDTSMSQVIQQETRSLQLQIKGIQSQVDALRLIANRSGRVHARGLELRLGTLVREGDILMTIATDKEKEVIAIVHQNDVAPVRSRIGQRVPIRTASFHQIDGTVDRVEPRAKVRLEAPALSALNGGSLAVLPTNRDNKDSSADAARLVEPHFTTRISIDPKTAASLPDGMRLDASIGYRHDTVWQRIERAISQLWTQSQDAANSR